MPQSSFLSRYTEIVTLLCGGQEPASKDVVDWLMHRSEELQSFAVNNGPEWAQGIALLDSAWTMANEGVIEGEDYETFEEFFAKNA